MPTFPLLAQTTGLSLENGALIIATIFGGSGLLLAALLLAARGYWSSHVSPLIHEEIKKWHEQPEQVDISDKAHLTAVRNWYDHKDQRTSRTDEVQNILRHPTVVSEQKQAVRDILDNEIKRKDGLISKEIQTQVTDMETRLMTKLEEVSQFLRDDTSFKREIIERMATLEGTITAVFPRASSDKAPASPLRAPTTSIKSR
jgi:hypothetical protein